MGSGDDKIIFYSLEPLEAFELLASLAFVV